MARISLLLADWTSTLEYCRGVALGVALLLETTRMAKKFLGSGAGGERSLLRMG
jgi:hypothetical protein